MTACKTDKQAGKLSERNKSTGTIKVSEKNRRVNILWTLDLLKIKLLSASLYKIESGLKHKIL